MDLLNANILVMTLYHSSGNCYHCGKLGKGCTRSLCIVSETAYESTISSKYFNIILKVQMFLGYFLLDYSCLTLWCVFFFFLIKDNPLKNAMSRGRKLFHAF